MSFKQEPTDNIDYDRFVDFDQVVLSPGASASKGKSIHTPDISSQTSNFNNLLAQQQQNAQAMFSGPSHRYDEHTQQTGLPSGALANALAANPNTAFHAGGYTNTFGSSSGVDFDFNAAMPQQFDSTDMDVDFNTPLDGFYGHNAGFVDPNMIGGHEEASPPPTRTEVVRMWPGMHTRQAQLAKQQQQQEIQRQQQAKVGQQQPQPTQGHRRTGSKTNGAPTRAADPLVEERISRLLNQMRHGSVASSNDDNTTPQASQSQSQRTKKDEEDMDEDERLLASEEGKKLSSKERRQLRNKVSARAFRSRRKEYIGQLEGELALKGQEADELRADNEALKVENNRLTDLTKMLLSSSAFSQFLNDLSANGMTSLPDALNAHQQSSQQQSQSQQQPQQVAKDTNSNSQNVQMQQQNSMQVGMTMIPEHNMDFLAPSNGNWNTGMDYQVYSLTELPQGPAPDTIDTGILSGKTSNFVPSLSEGKDDVPVIESMPKSEVAVDTPTTACTDPVSTFIDESVDFDESDPAFALFVDYDTSSTTSKSVEPVDNIFGDVALEKAVARFDLIIESEQSTGDASEDVSAAVMARFECLCSSLDMMSSRVASLCE